jgi:hypothetical protein
MSPKCLHSTILRVFPSRFDNLSQGFTTGKEQIPFLSSYTIETRVLKKKFSCFAQLRSDVARCLQLIKHQQRQQKAFLQ